MGIDERANKLQQPQTYPRVLAGMFIYMLGGEVLFMSGYDKNMVRRDNVEYILRFLPAAVGVLLVRYLVFVRPFARALEEDKRKDDYLFATTHGSFTERQTTPALKRVTKGLLGYASDGLGFAAYRHVAIAIARCHCAEYHDWHDTELGDDPLSDAEDNVFDRSRTAELHYAVPTGFLRRIQQPQVTAFRKASQAWHRLLVHPMVKASQPTTPLFSIVDHRCSSSQTLEPTIVKRPAIAPISNTAADQLAEEMRLAVERPMGPTGRYKLLEQQEAMRFVLQHRDASIVVLRTAGGKSLLFMGVATLEPQRINIVIVPYLVLLEDLVGRATALGICAHPWMEDMVGDASLVVVSADLAVLSSFLRYITDLAVRRRLRHLFFDECRVAITETSFRDRLEYLWLLCNILAPFTCLTATLPPVLKDVFR
ncbi:MAG: hypothetical protein M1826_004934 [Phylliscum demangeonii]|nr:MAG: hypothetical protein M1826_004934 [Phylliscum demangeonii]